jgi:hypothetical protein
MHYRSAQSFRLAQIGRPTADTFHIDIFAILRLHFRVIFDMPPFPSFHWLAHDTFHFS